MSKFYNRYLENNGVAEVNKPTFIQLENRLREINREHMRQANMTTRGKHTGSKSKDRLLFNIHRGQRMIQGIMSGYAE